jgi:hypothetical protein
LSIRRSLPVLRRRQAFDILAEKPLSSRWKGSTICITLTAFRIATRSAVPPFGDLVLVAGLAAMQELKARVKVSFGFGRLGGVTVLWSGSGERQLPLERYDWCSVGGRQVFSVRIIIVTRLCLGHDTSHAEGSAECMGKFCGASSTSSELHASFSTWCRSISHPLQP